MNNPSRLRIAEVAPLWSSIPPPTWGGTERVIHALTEELVRRGHDVTLFATGDSKTSARLRAIREYSLFDGYLQGEFWRHEHYHVANIVEALRDSGSYDIIHCHLGCLSIPFSILSPVPLIHSMPALLRPDDLWMLARYPEAIVTARSHRQISVVPPERRQGMHVIYNGCDFDACTVSPAPGRYLAFLGRMSPDKNPLGCIRIAEAAGMPIVLAGEAWEDEGQEYFDAQVRPLIDGKQVTWIGGVTDPEKNEFFRDAAGLLFPIQWEEPFGIVMIEAMARGVPVVASNRGSVSEVVDPGITGFYADSVEELPQLVQRAMQLDRSAVREHARRRFSAQAMADGYLRLYLSSLEAA